MKYKNIVFDYGNVIAKFDGLAILRSFCESQEDADLLRDIVYRQWPDLDRGTLEYDDYLQSTLELTPPHSFTTGQKKSHTFQTPLHLSKN